MFTTSFSNYSLLTELERSTIQKNEISILYIFENKFHFMKLNTLLIGMLFSICTFAQITIESNDIATIGDEKTLITDYAPSSISLGNAGENQMWNFSSLEIDTVYNLEFIDPSFTPFSNDFYVSNLAYEIDAGFVYLFNSEEALYELGYGIQNGGENTTFWTGELVLEFPTNYGDVFENSIVLDTTLTIEELGQDGAGFEFLMPGIFAIKYKLDSSSTSTVDAWGNVALQGEDHDVLRVEKSSFATDTIFGTDYTPNSYYIETQGMSFTPDEITVNILDTVHFQNLGYHNATEVDQNTWNANGTEYNGGFVYENDGWHVFTEPGIYYYVCTPHASMGMKGKIIVEDNIEWEFLIADFQTSGETSKKYSWYTDDQNIGMPLVEIFLNSEDEIERAVYVGNNQNIPSWNCIEGACIDPSDGSGIYNSLASCEEECGSNFIDEITFNKIYPNPTKNNLNIELNGSKQIYSLLGELLITTDKDIVDVSRLSKGVYLIKTNNTTYKFMKE